MALFLEFVLTIALSLVFSFLLAKLFSVSSSSSCINRDDNHVPVLSPRKLIIEKLVSYERVFVAESRKNGFESEPRTGFVAEVVEADDFGDSREGEFGNQDGSGCGSRDGFETDESEVLRELSEGSCGECGGASEYGDNFAVERTESGKIAKIEEDITKHEVGVARSEEIEVPESEFDREILEANKNEEDGGMCDCEEITVDGSTESERLNKIEGELCRNEIDGAKSENETGEANQDGDNGVKEALFDMDDDWEGIERTELERLFGSAVAFIGSKGNADRISSLASPVKLQLYGLHKIATQGPCYEPQPMPLKVSARAYWNAWKSLGNMTQEDAMEQYVSILSRSIPGCIQDDIGGISKQVFADCEAFSKLPSDLKTWKMNKVGPVDERDVDEVMPGTQGLGVSKSSICP